MNEVSIYYISRCGCRIRISRMAFQSLVDSIVFGVVLVSLRKERTMTREECIERIKNIKCLVIGTGLDAEALDMAIEALQWQDRILKQIEDIVLKEHGERREE